MTCRCTPRHRGAPLLELHNPAAPHVDPAARFVFGIVPGYTPRLGWQGGLHPEATARLDVARRALERGLCANLILSGGAVHTPDNEAWLMREYLLARGLDPARLFVEPCARHTTTNLRNAGRMLLGFGVDQAVIITTDRPDWSPRRFFLQAFYVGRPWLSGFHARCYLELGYQVGELDWLAPGLVHFRPSAHVQRETWKERWMGDP